MKITKIEVVQNKKPIVLPEAWRPAWHEPDAKPVKTANFSFYKVYTDEGIVGIGPYSGPVDPFVKDLLIGRDPTYVERFWDVAMRGLGALLNRGSYAGLEVALWDIIGKAAGKPVYKLIGAYRDKVMAYAATYQIHSAEEHAKEAVEFRERGIRAIKLRLHRPKPEMDIEVVRAVRDAVGDDMIIMVDANQNHPSAGYRHWSTRTALKVARELERMDVFFLEEPLPRLDLKALAELRSKVDIQIAGGEHATSIYDLRNALFAGAYDIIQPDLILGHIGIIGIKKLAVMAESMNRTLIPHVCDGGNMGLLLAATLQALCTVKNAPFVEYPLEPPSVVPEFAQKILENPILIDKDGYVHVPEEPGIGVKLDENVLAEYSSEVVAVYS